jgi:hypothetical protein
MAFSFDGRLQPAMHRSGGIYRHCGLKLKSDRARLSDRAKPLAKLWQDRNTTGSNRTAMRRAYEISRFSPGR